MQGCGSLLTRHDSPEVRVLYRVPYPAGDIRRSLRDEIPNIELVGDVKESRWRCVSNESLQRDKWRVCARCEYLHLVPEPERIVHVPKVEVERGELREVRE